MLLPQYNHWEAEPPLRHSHAEHRNERNKRKINRPDATTAKASVLKAEVPLRRFEMRK